MDLRSSGLRRCRKASVGMMVASLAAALSAASTTAAAPASAGTLPSSSASWAVAQTAGHGAVAGFLDGITCPSASSCVAVGNDLLPSGYAHALVETLNDGAWSKTVLPLPTSQKAQATFLFSVACPPGGGCVAVGYYYEASNGYPLIETESTAGSWSVTPAPPVLSNQAAAFLNGVACPVAGHCLAVGNDGNDLPWVISLAGGKWQTDTLPVMVMQTGSLNGISCTSVTSCVAVGDEVTGSGENRTLVLVLHGSQWTDVPVPGTGQSSAVGLSSVSCQSVTSCVAVGELGGAAPTVLVETAGKWAVVPQAAPRAGEAATGLWGLWCSAGSCLAVGSLSSFGAEYAYGGAVPGPQGALIEQESGGHWSTVAAPAGLPQQSGLRDAACTTTMCVAVGMTGATDVGASNGSTARTLILES